MKTLLVITILFISSSITSQNDSRLAYHGDPVYYSLEVALLHPERVLFLDLSDAFLKEVPEEIGELKNLIGLDLSNNQFEIIPESILAQLSLEELYISGNPLVDSKQDIVENTLDD